ncbi:MAG: hypothetical protein JWO86_3843 [Myxococcaceae bacterium]|nr:hypothetical protein [Myxococcaceae bacterium]
MTFTGGCHCGRVRFRVRAAQLDALETSQLVWPAMKAGRAMMPSR